MMLMVNLIKKEEYFFIILFVHNTLDGETGLQTSQMSIKARVNKDEGGKITI